MSKVKERVDILLVDRGLCESREKAKRSIMAGLVYSDTVRIDKPGEKLPIDANLEVKGKECPYVGRGGYKLEKALSYFNITVRDKIVADIGSSTGGFTDCALQNGAAMSYAIDVGYNQLAWKLRNDPRVVVMERTNFRHATIDMFNQGQPDFACIDVSFISLRLILPALKDILVANGQVVALVKPQFEAGKELVGNKGIVRDKKVHKLVLDDIIDFSLKTGFTVIDLTYSPITGGDGNIEFLLYLKWLPTEKNVFDFSLIDRTIEEAHNNLKG
jgi:23S rRNA (cytidine1920-2'-O)/16S rRNA (cytidine1409-2'-O)-methyltransferase